MFTEAWPVVHDALTHVHDVGLSIHSWLPWQLPQVSCVLHFLLNAWLACMSPTMTLMCKLVCMLLFFIYTCGKSNCCLMSSGTAATEQMNVQSSHGPVQPCNIRIGMWIRILQQPGFQILRKMNITTKLYYKTSRECHHMTENRH